jgi:ADP-heptose:LPS heptosyltransferase
VFLARIPERIGYARQGRSIFLTQNLRPERLVTGNFKAVSMVDYYLELASAFGAETTDRRLELAVQPEDHQIMLAKLPEAARPEGPVVVLVPGGAFGPSKCWPPDRFARTADWLVEHRMATVFVSAAFKPAEKAIAHDVCSKSKSTLINLAERPLTLGQLKALFSIAELVITNDTGPRHIGIAMGRKVVTLFGPNDPAWTDTGYDNEIQLVGVAPCAPCARPKCDKPQHLCMNAITVEMVCQAAKQLLEGPQHPVTLRAGPQFQEISPSFFVDSDYEAAFHSTGLTSLHAIFSFKGGLNLTKTNLAAYRSRLRFKIESPTHRKPVTAFLKRYDRTPALSQVKNWLAFRKRASFARLEFDSTTELAAMGINTPRTIAYGEQWGSLFEQRSFIITQKIPDAEPLERKLPDCFAQATTAHNLRLRRKFILQLAAFVKRFHQTGYRHCDLYFSHIFYDGGGQLHLIDLSRAFRPAVLTERFRLKDITQLHYSAPASVITKADRLRFYLSYSGHQKLNTDDRAFIRKVTARAKRMARHDAKHGRCVPFAQAVV